MTEEEKENWASAAYKMQDEGFDYCWRCYSDFKEIEDEKFHELRRSYITAANALEEYVNAKKELSESE